MSGKTTGGSAYPMVLGDTPISAGMTLRDYFAAAAIKGGLCFHQEDGCSRDHEEAATEAYKLADAMLAERSKP